MADPLEIVTVRIPELNPHPGPLALGDKIPIWYADLNKTRHTTLSDIRDFVLTGGEGAALPVIQNGDAILKIITAGEAGSNIVSIPALAGMTFKLRRSGQPLIPQKNTTPDPADEYQCLSAGGFKLLQAGDILEEGERFELTVFALQGGSSGSGSTSSSALITGQVLVTTNFTFDPTDHLNKLISIRSDTNIITFTLPDIDAVPENTIIPIETTILNTFQPRITTQGGQYIYLRNNNYTSVYMGKSESLWLYRGVDGWYEVNGFANNYENVGKIQASYKVGLNELLADGSLVSRTAHPRLWEGVQSIGGGLVDEATWQTASVGVQGRTVLKPFRGCFSTGTDSTNFRLPDLRNMALRGFLSGDIGRWYNSVGGYQRHEFESHNHDIKYELNGTDGVNNGEHIWDNGGDESNPTGTNTFAIQSAGGPETRMDNVAVLWTIKE